MSEIESQIFLLAAFVLIGFVVQGFRSDGDIGNLRHWFEGDGDCGD